MKKLITCLAIALLIFGSCKKQADSTNNQLPAGEGGISFGNISGTFNITLSKNVDTTITMTISAQIENFGRAGGGPQNVTFQFGSLPTDIDSVSPAYYDTIVNSPGGIVGDTFRFHIKAIDTGKFPVVVTAKDSSIPIYGAKDTFYLIVH